MLDHSEEDGGTECLGIIPGQVRRFPVREGFMVHYGDYTIGSIKEYLAGAEIPVRR